MKELIEKVAFVILNYNNSQDTVECIESVQKIDYKNFEIILIDNDSTDDSVDILSSKFPEITLIQTGINLGYAGGNNVGIKKAIDSKADYICVLNNDVVVDTNFLTILIDSIKKNPDIGIIGPRICEYSQPTIIQSTGATINLNRGTLDIINGNCEDSSIPFSLLDCDYIGGACMLFSKDLIANIGYIPEDYFLFYEETEWCLKAKKLGYRVVCNTESKVIHKGSASIGKVSGLAEYYLYRNRVYFIKKNASVKNKLIFYPYLILTTFYKVLLKKQNKKSIKFYLDGFCEKDSYRK